MHEALSSATFHGLREPVIVVPTACSTVYIAGDMVYKVKRPVALGYLDFTTLEARRTACEAEVALNRDLAPGVYQRIAPIRVTAEGRVTVDDPHAPTERGGDIVNFAVVMRRLPASGMLDRVLRERELTRDEATALAHVLVRFHAGAPAGPDVGAFGAPDRVRAELRENAAQLAAVPGHGLPAHLLAHVTQWLIDEWARQRGAIEHRCRRGRVREGHGDLHAGNVCLDPTARTSGNPHGIVIYDRLEFRRDFRCRDTAAEVACLAASCQALGRWETAANITSQYALKADDGALLGLVNLWCAHYALVRSKVAAITAARADAPLERESEHARARALLHLAVATTLPPALILSCGLPGSGKSFVAGHVVRALGAKWIRTDEVRKELAGLNPTARAGDALYAPEVTARVYDEVVARARDALPSHTTVMDATFRTPSARAPLLALARELGAPALIIHCHASEAETRRRIAARSAAGTDASDADYRVYEQMMPTFVPPADAEARVVDAGEGVPMPDLVERVLTALIAVS